MSKSKGFLAIFPCNYTNVLRCFALIFLTWRCSYRGFSPYLFMGKTTKGFLFREDTTRGNFPYKEHIFCVFLEHWTPENLHNEPVFSDHSPKCTLILICRMCSFGNITFIDKQESLNVGTFKLCDSFLLCVLKRFLAYTSF